MKTFLISLIASFFLPVALADNLNQEQKNALKEVMNQLTNPSARMEQLKNDKKLKIQIKL
ncbi:hypothetical protein EBQ74_12990 [bacterium]|nr:hypothetical protein [bacterium]